MNSGQLDHGTPLLPEDPEQIGGYRLVARLGSGGMGRVYLGVSESGRPLAIKALRTDLMSDPLLRKRFVREVSAARKVPGAFTAEVVDADPYGDPPWLASVFIPGPSLSRVVRLDGPLSARTTKQLMAGVAEALIAIHGAGIAHRDLKPSNILLADDGPRVIDFGIAYASDATELTRTGESPGTPAYMAPEQLAGDTAVPSIDVFALGSVACFAATGRPAFGGESSVAIALNVLHSEPRLDQVPAELVPLISQCLSKDPADRPTLRELLQACADPATARLPLFSTGWFRADAVTRPTPGPAPAPEPARMREADRRLEFDFAAVLLAAPEEPEAVESAASTTAPVPLPVSVSASAPTPVSTQAGSGEVRNGAVLAGSEVPTVSPAVSPRSRVRRVTLAVALAAVVAVISAGLIATSSHSGATTRQPRSGSSPTSAVLGKAAVLATPPAAAGSTGASLTDAAFTSPDDAGVTSIVPDAAGDLLAVADSDGNAFVRNVSTGRTVVSIRGNPDQSPYNITMSPSAALNPSGTIIAVSEGYLTVKLYGVPSGASLATLHEPHGEGIISLAFSPDGTMLATADSGEYSLLWNVQNPGAAHELLDTGAIDGQDEVVSYLGFSQNSKSLVVAGQDGEILTFDIASKAYTTASACAGGCDGNPDCSGIGGDGSLAVSLDGTVAACDESNAFEPGPTKIDIRRLTGTTGPELVLSCQTSASGSSADALALSPDGATLAVDEGPDVVLYDTRSGSIEQTFAVGAATANKPRQDLSSYVTYSSLFFEDNGSVLVASDGQYVLSWHVSS